eukprot:198963-Chlamydomonas_euryale.AAC.3
MEAEPGPGWGLLVSRAREDVGRGSAKQALPHHAARRLALRRHRARGVRPRKLPMASASTGVPGGERREGQRVRELAGSLGLSLCLRRRRSHHFAPEGRIGHRAPPPRPVRHGEPTSAPRLARRTYDHAAAAALSAAAAAAAAHAMPTRRTRSLKPEGDDFVWCRRTTGRGFWGLAVTDPPRPPQTAPCRRAGPPRRGAHACAGCSRGCGGRGTPGR